MPRGGSESAGDRAAAGCGAACLTGPRMAEGMEGHQPPYLSLGDPTVLVEGMMLSNEPGLYNVPGGFGYNHGNNLLVGTAIARQMNQTPMTKEWCFIKI